MSKYINCVGGWVWEILTKEEAINAFNDGKEVHLMYTNDKDNTNLVTCNAIVDWVDDGTTLLVTGASAIYLSTISVTDPETSNSIDLDVYKDRISGAMIAVDSSWPKNLIASPYEPNTLTHIYLE